MRSDIARNIGTWKSSGFTSAARAYNLAAFSKSPREELARP
jgi:hypothetical protein